MHFSATTPEELWDEISMKGFHLAVDRDVFLARFSVLSSPLDHRQQFCYTQLTAHPDVVIGAGKEFFRRVVGLLSLQSQVQAVEPCRVTPDNQGVWYINYAPGMPRPRSLAGVTIAGKPCMPLGEPAIGFHDLDFPTFLPISIEPGSLPVQQEDFAKAQHFFGSSESKYALMRSLVASAIVRPTGPIPVLEPMRSATRFWSQAELAGNVLGHLGDSPWDLAERFLNYCTVLEILLGAKESVSEVIAARSAAIVAIEAEERLERFRHIKRLYGKRSRYIHDGSVVLDMHDLKDIRDVTRRCLVYGIEWLTSQVTHCLLEHAEEMVEWGSQSAERHTTGDCRWSDQEADKFTEMVFNKEDIGEFTDHCDLLRFGGERIAIERDE